MANVFFVSVLLKTKEHYKRHALKIGEVKNSLMILTLTIAFILVGTLVFIGIEGTAEQLKHWQILDEHEALDSSITSVITEMSPNLSISEVESGKRDLQGHLLKVATTKCYLQKDKAWSYHDTVNFCQTIISTIGYGVYYPTQTASKVFCIFYAIFGIPLFINLLEYIDISLRHLHKVSSKAVSSVFVYVFCVVMALLVILFARLIRLDQEAFEEYLNTLEHVIEVNNNTKPSDLYIVGHEDPWTYFATVYFIFITVFCIGFGDLYLYTSPPHIIILKTVISLIFQAVLIGMFSYMFSAVTDNVEDKVTLLTVNAGTQASTTSVDMSVPQDSATSATIHANTAAIEDDD